MSLLATAPLVVLLLTAALAAAVPVRDLRPAMTLVETAGGVAVHESSSSAGGYASGGRLDYIKKTFAFKAYKKDIESGGAIEVNIEFGLERGPTSLIEGKAGYQTAGGHKFESKIKLLDSQQGFKSAVGDKLAGRVKLALASIDVATWTIPSDPPIKLAATAKVMDFERTKTDLGLTLGKIGLQGTADMTHQFYELVAEHFGLSAQALELLKSLRYKITIALKGEFVVKPEDLADLDAMDDAIRQRHKAERQLAELEKKTQALESDRDKIRRQREALKEEQKKLKRKQPRNPNKRKKLRAAKQRVKDQLADLDKQEKAISKKLKRAGKAKKAQRKLIKAADAIFDKHAKKLNGPAAKFFGQAMKKAGMKTSVKIIGRLGTRAIPIVGWIITAIDSIKFLRDLKDVITGKKQFSLFGDGDGNGSSGVEGNGSGASGGSGQQGGQQGGEAGGQQGGEGSGGEGGSGGSGASGGNGDSGSGGNGNGGDIQCGDDCCTESDPLCDPKKIEDSNPFMEDTKLDPLSPRAQEILKAIPRQGKGQKLTRQQRRQLNKLFERNLTPQQIAEIKRRLSSKKNGGDFDSTFAVLMRVTDRVERNVPEPGDEGGSEGSAESGAESGESAESGSAESSGASSGTPSGTVSSGGSSAHENSGGSSQNSENSSGNSQGSAHLLESSEVQRPASGENGNTIDDATSSEDSLTHFSDEGSGGGSGGDQDADDGSAPTEDSDDSSSEGSSSGSGEGSNGSSGDGSEGSGSSGSGGLGDTDGESGEASEADEPHTSQTNDDSGESGNTLATTSSGESEPALRSMGDEVHKANCPFKGQFFCMHNMRQAFRRTSEKPLEFDFAHPRKELLLGLDLTMIGLHSEVDGEVRKLESTHTEMLPDIVLANSDRVFKSFQVTYVAEVVTPSSKDGAPAAGTKVRSVRRHWWHESLGVGVGHIGASFSVRRFLENCVLGLYLEPVERRIPDASSFEIAKSCQGKPWKFGKVIDAIPLKITDGVTAADRNSYKFHLHLKVTKVHPPHRGGVGADGEWHEYKVGETYVRPVVRDISALNNQSGSKTSKFMMLF
eukprot:TRINITY_DN67527_c6_g2_i2.p1 TRINITY_DN67527_c6_g2~~TRINITY_DN67527_c6_g2_i2.p1  ORF type:complete len:1099 (-),score=591.22 TRINITY_DN67527_c6_g2_i2:194-3391(-)